MAGKPEADMPNAFVCEHLFENRKKAATAPDPLHASSMHGIAR